MLSNGRLVVVGGACTFYLCSHPSQLQKFYVCVCVYAFENTARLSFALLKAAF